MEKDNYFLKILLPRREEYYDSSLASRKTKVVNSFSTWNERAWIQIPRVCKWLNKKEIYAYAPDLEDMVRLQVQ